MRPIASLLFASIAMALRGRRVALVDDTPQPVDTDALIAGLKMRGGSAKRPLPVWFFGPKQNKLPKALSYRARKAQIRKENKFKTVAGMWEASAIWIVTLLRWHKVDPAEFYTWYSKTKYPCMHILRMEYRHHGLPFVDEP